ncbi:MAG: protein-disulfide reductase DsbD family protein [Fidelibacterota bacterium]
MRPFLSFFAFFLGFLFQPVEAQFENPVKVTAEVTQPARTGEVVDVVLTAEMDQEWHLYAVYDAGEGPISTSISVSGEIVEQQGAVQEPPPVESYDEGFGTNTRYHIGTTQFTIPVKLKPHLAPGTYQLKTKILFQVCNASLCYPPKEEVVTVPVVIEAGAPRPDRTEMASATTDVFDRSGNIDLQAAINKGFWSFILLSLSMGFLALLTPCVFPMIPITVSFFTHQGEMGVDRPVRQAGIYVAGIIATFSLLGFLLAATLGAAGANQLAANPLVNLFLGGLFVFFALSLFGMYEIQVPEKLRQLSLKQEKRGGVIGTLFMAVTFTLTSFTCTVQFMGLLLVAAAQGQWFWPAVGMIIFSAAFATPFFFLALFPQYLSKLPKSGSWLNSVKVVMGFLELAAAFKFFSNSDIVWQWGFFSQKMVLASWAGIMIFTGIYLLGKIQLPHDTPLKSVGVGRLLLSMAFVTFGIYLSSGLFGQRIHGLIYSYLPPVVEKETGSVKTDGSSIAKEFIWFNELEDGLREAKRLQKPVFVDFTGYTCTNCRWMEANIFTHPDVRERFGEFVLVQLYTDGGKNYREHQQYEIDRFGTAALPFYVILSPEDEVLVTFPGMTRDVEEFLDFLDQGLAG